MAAGSTGVMQHLSMREGETMAVIDSRMRRSHEDVHYDTCTQLAGPGHGL